MAQLRHWQSQLAAHDAAVAAATATANPAAAVHDGSSAAAAIEV